MTESRLPAVAAPLLALVLLVPVACARPADKPDRGREAHVEDPRHYPSFSWDRIPLYMHIRKATSFSDKEIAYLARFPLITFEKSTGHKDHGSIEKGTLVAARAVRKVNPDATILYYRNVMVHYGGYEANRAMDKIPGALLVDKKGNSKLIRNRVAAYDLSNAELRRWWVDNCKTILADPVIDGVFLDGTVKALVPGFLLRQIGAEKRKQVTKGFYQMMDDTRSAIGPDKLMLANMIRARFKNAGLEFMQHFDGSYLEAFFHNVGGMSYEEYAAKGIDAMQKAARDGKIIAFTSGLAMPGNKSKMGIDEAHAKVKSDEAARKGLVYPLAVFLVCAEKHSYFRVHEGYSADTDDRWMRWFPEFDRPLGPPAGPAQRNGHVYTRKFKHADVKVDIGTRRGEINWR